MIKVIANLDGVERVINGDGQNIKGTITQEVGAINSFEFEIFPQNIGFDLIQSRKTLVKATNTVTGRVEFAGRVLLAEQKMESNGVISKRVTCESYLGYLYDSVQPFAEEATMSLRDFLQLVIDNHNACVGSSKRLQLGTVNVDVAGTGNVTKGLQYETTYDTIKSKLVDIYGGELEVVENSGGLTLNYVKQIGTTRATTIELGRNMQAASREVSPLEIITRLIPLGAKIKKKEKDEEGNETEIETGERLTLVGYTPAGGSTLAVPWIDDEEKQGECDIVCGVLDLDDVTTQDALYSKAIDYMRNKNLVALSHTLTALDLKEIGQAIDGLNCGDSYPVKNELIGLDEILRITKKTIDINAPYKSSITIGEKRATLSSIQADTNATIGELFGTIQTINKTANSLKEHVSSAENSLNELTSKVEGIEGTYFYIRYSPYADGHVMTDAPAEDTVYMGTCSTNESTAPTDYKKYKWARIKGNDGEDGTAGANGVSHYLHIKYSDDGVNFTANNGETLGDWLGTCVDENKSDPLNFNAYTWKKIKGETGLRGESGIDGKDGVDGKTTYFHVKYSDVPNPTTSSQLTEVPSKYIGTYVDYTEADSTDPSKYTWVKFMGEDGIDGKDGQNGLAGKNGIDGKTYYLHIKYSNDGGATFTANNGEESGEYIGVYTDTTEADSTDPKKYKWSKIKGADGIDGIDGKTYYTWIKYADTPTSGMSNSPEGKKYMGLAYNKETATESSNYSDYTWSLIKGEDGSDGVNGTDGSDGVTYYTWVKYADDDKGANMSNDPTNKKYIGLAYNKTTPTESNNASDYSWALFRGEDGVDGTPSYFYVRYSANANGSSMTTAPTSTTQYMGVCATTSATAPTDYTKYTWTKIKGEQGQQGQAGAAGADGKTSYLHIKYSDDGKTFTGNLTPADISQWLEGLPPQDDNTTIETELISFAGILTFKNALSVTPATKLTITAHAANAQFLIYEYDANGVIKSLAEFDLAAGGTANYTVPSAVYYIKVIAVNYSFNSFEEYVEAFNSGTFIPDIRNSAETNAGETLGGWIGTYVDFNEADSTDPTKYKWVKFTADVDEDLKNLKETITLLSTDVTNTSKEITLLAEKNYIERDEYKEFKEHTESQFTQTADDITMEFEKAVTLIDNASAANSAEIESAFNELKSYIRYYMNDSGQPVIELGASASPLTCKLLNDKISFLDNGVEVAYLSNNQLYITDATILSSMNIGNFKILPRSNGNLSIM